MKKHRMEIAALTLLLGVLCYAFYDCNIRGNEQNIVLSNELFSMRDINSEGKKEVQNKEEITMEMISNNTEDVIEETNEVVEVYEEEKEVVTYEENVYSINLAATEENVVPYNEIISNQVVNYALNFVGNPYVYGGNSLTNGTDCSGFTKLIFAEFGIYLPRTAFEQGYSGVRVGLNNIMPGDLVLSGYGGTIGHVAIYIGNNKLVHALNSNVGIVVTDLYIMPILDVRRVI